MHVHEFIRMIEKVSILLRQFICTKVRERERDEKNPIGLYFAFKMLHAPKLIYLL